MSNRKRQTVYFIKPIGMDGPIKIGCSVSPDARRESLETWSPFPLEIVAEIEGGFRLEGQFHARHREAFKSREWFEPTTLLLADIAAISAGEFDVSTLPPPIKIGITGKPREGKKWTDQQKRNVRLRNAVTRACKASGLSCPYDYSDPRIHDFIADPHSHGRPWEEAEAERQAKWREQRIAFAERQYAEALERIEAQTARRGA